MSPSSDIQPLVSIITPTYNHSSFIRVCIESALAQTYSNWEQIIIDDGSTDDTVKIISEYQDTRIHCEAQSHRGPFELATTYNRALSLAKGELVAILEGDDFWPPTKLASMVPLFLSYDVVLAYGEAVDVDPGGREQRNKSWTTRLRQRLDHPVLFNDPVGTATRHMLTAEGRSLIAPSTVLIRRNRLEQIGGFQQVHGLPLTDYPTFMELGLAGKFSYLNQPLGYRRRHRSSITMNHTARIHEKVSSFTLDFLARHQDMLTLAPFERRRMENNWKEAEDKQHFSEGRLLLLQRKWREARRSFRAASGSKVPLVRGAALAGFLLSWLHIDIEFLMRLGGRADLGGQI